MNIRFLVAVAGCAAALATACKDPSAAAANAHHAYAPAGHTSHAPADGDAALQLRDAWARASLPGARTAAGYLTITNAGNHTDTLLSASTPMAAQVEMHRTLIEDGIAKMRPADDLAIAPGATLKAEPGGLHLMLTDLQAPLTEGEAVPLTLTFRHAGAITVQLVARSATDMGPSAAQLDPH